MSSPGDGRAPLVSARGISRRFPGVLALDNVDHNIQAGVSPENILALFETGYEHGFYG